MYIEKECCTKIPSAECTKYKMLLYRLGVCGFLHHSMSKGP